MLKHDAIQIALLDIVNSTGTSTQSLEHIRTERDRLCESIAHGLFAIGDMMTSLGCLADEESQNFSSKALDNQTVTQLGELIKANAYFLNTLRETSSQANFNLNSGIKGAK